jgi:hypothetical protein
MRNNQFAVVLAGLLAISTLVTAWLTFRYVSSVQKLQVLQPQLANVNNSRSIIISLVNDTLEYSKHNKDIDPLLQAMNLKPGGAVVAPTPNTKPTNR